MPSKRQKGNLFQDWCEKWIKKNYPDASIHNQKTVAKLIKVRDHKTGQLKDIWVSQRNDLFGCIDLAVIIPGKRSIFIQATEDQHVAKRLAELEGVDWNFDYSIIQLWIKRKPGRISIKNYRGEELTEIGEINRGKFSHKWMKEWGIF